MEVKAWRCWYDDNNVYNSKDHQWADLPEDGFQIRILYYENGTKQIQQGMDYYYEAEHSSGETIYGTNMHLENITDRYASPVIKQGRWAPDGFYQDLVKIAMASTWL